MNSYSWQNSFSDVDLYLFHEGKHLNAYKFMGAHVRTEDGVEGVRFTTWAPNASRIVVIGDFSHWELRDENSMQRISDLELGQSSFPEQVTE